MCRRNMTEYKTGNEMQYTRIQGYASIYNQKDADGDIVMPGAFRKCLEKKLPVRMLYQHSPDVPLGVWTDFHEREKGLYAGGELILQSPRSKEISVLIKGGAIDGLSIGYSTVRSARSGSGRRIIEADLWEVSVVTFPMAPSARITETETYEREERIYENDQNRQISYTYGKRGIHEKLSGFDLCKSLKKASEALKVNYFPFKIAE